MHFDGSIFVPEVDGAQPEVPENHWGIHAKSDGLYTENSFGAEYNLLEASQVPVVPPSGTSNRNQYFSRLLTDDGEITGSGNQNVDGSGTPVTFHLHESDDYDIYISQISIEVSDSVITYGKFGNIPSGVVVNGFSLKLIDESGVALIVDSAKTVGELVVGTGCDGCEIYTNFSGRDDAIIINFKLRDYMTNGFRIGRGNIDELESVVSDDFTGLSFLRVRVFGERVFPDE